MKRVTTNPSKGKQKVLGEVNLITVEEYNAQDFNAKVEMIRQLIPLGLMLIHQTLQEAVKQLVGERYSRDKTNPHLVRYGSNPGSVKVGGQRHPIQVPRVRDRSTQTEVPLSCLQQLKGSGETDERLLKQVLYGISCRNYEAAAESIPGAIGLSSSTVSRSFIQASARQLREFQERDLSSYDIVALFLDGKTFAEDTMVIAMGVTMKGEKVFLGFVQTGTENGAVLSSFLTEMLERGLSIEEGLLVVIDGSKGMRAAIKKVFKSKAVIQRCQWHKRENVLNYLTKSQQAGMRRRLQRAYDKPTYQEAKSALKKILVDLDKLNVSAAASLREGLEETLTLHRLGLFPLVGISLKTTNCLESINRMVEDRCRKVTCWKNASQKHRWLAACLMDIEPRTRRIKGYRHLSKLREKLREEIGIAPVKQAA